MKHRYAAGARSMARRWAAGIGLAFAPITVVTLLAGLNASWLFPPISWLDPWQYLAVARDWATPELQQGQYKISRLGAVIPGWLIHDLGGSYWGFLIAMAVVLIATGALFAIGVGRIWGFFPGIIAGVLASGWTTLQFSGAVGYHNQWAGLWMGAALVALSFARGAGPRGRLYVFFAGGLLLGLMIHASPIFLNLGPFFILLGIAVLPVAVRRSWAVLGLSAAAAVAGVVAMTGILALASVAVGRRALFFLDGATLARSFLENPEGQLQWWIPLRWNWLTNPDLGGSPHLVIAALGLMAAIAVLVWRQREPGRWRYGKAARLTATGVILTGLIAIVWNWGGQTSLYPEYFTYHLGLTCAVGVALLASRDSYPALSVSSPQRPWWSYAWRAIGLGLCFALPMLVLPIMPMGLLRPDATAAVLLAAILLAALAFLAIRPRTTAWVAISLAALGIANTINVSRSSGNSPVRSWMPAGDACRGGIGQGFVAASQAIDWLDEQLPGQRGLTQGGTTIWWPPSAEHMIIPCTGGQNAAGLFISLHMMTYGRIYDATGEPSLSDIPEPTLAALADAQRTMVSLLPISPDGQAKIPTGRGYYLTCDKTRRFPLAAPPFAMCIGTIKAGNPPARSVRID